jgi:beta-glucanase (GH16 family)
LNSFAFKYGKVEIAAKLPAGDWLLPSIKFLPFRNAYGGWPASGEIDLFEARGNRDLIKSGVNIGIDQITSSLHFGPYAEADAWQLTSFTRNSNDKAKSFASGFHRYQMEWTSEKITFSVDDIVSMIEVRFINDVHHRIHEIGSGGSDYVLATLPSHKP